MTAKIGLTDVIIHAPHGFFEEEHAMGNTFSIDVEVDAEIGGAAHDDDLGQTVNYATIYYLLKAEMKKPTQLLEALAYRMAGRIADQFDNVTAVNLRLHKLNPPLGGKVGSSYVEVNVRSSLGGGARGWDSGINQPRTFEDEYVPHFDADGPFSRPGGGGSMTGAPRRPSSLPPGLDLPPLPTDDTPLPWHIDEYDEGLAVPSPFEPHAVSDEDLPLDDFELPDDFEEGAYSEEDLAGLEDFDPRDLPDMGGFKFNFKDLDLPEFDPDDRG